MEEVNEEDETPGRKQRTEQKLKRKGATQGAEGKTKWKGRVTSEMLLMPVFSLKSSAPFVLLFLSCQLVHFVASVLSLQLFPSIRYFLPFVSTPFNPVRYFFPFVSALSFCSLYVVPFVLNSSLPFVTSPPSFQRVHPVHLPLPFISRRSFRYVTSWSSCLSFPSRSFTSSFRFRSFISLPPSFRFNSSFLLVLLFVSFQLVHFIVSVLSLQLFPSIRYFHPFASTLFHPVRFFFPFVSTLRFCSLYVVSFALNSSLPFVTSSPSF